MPRCEIRIAGFGGQGIILAGYIIGKAAALYDGKNSVHTQSYGPEARGGACSAGVVLSDGSIDYPLVERPEILIVLSQPAFDVFGKTLIPGGTILLDEDLVCPNPAPPEAHILGIPATRLAEEMQKKIVANIVMLGFFVATTEKLSRAAVEKAISTTVPAPTVEVNLKAFAIGFEYGKKLLDTPAAGADGG